MDLVDLKGAINAANATTGITASIVKVSASDFRLVLTADETGKEVTLAGAGGDDVLGILGLSADGGATFSHPLAAAAQARISVDGVTVTRSTNQITDVIDGMTFSLFRADPGTTVTVEVERSLGDVKERLRGFVEAYNAYRDFVGKHATVSETGELADDAVLFGDSLLRSLSQGIGSAVGSPVAGLGAGALSSLAGIGIKLDPGNHLKLDEAVLDEKLVTDLDAVRNVLEFRFTASSADLGVFARTNDLADTQLHRQHRRRGWRRRSGECHRGRRGARRERRPAQGSLRHRLCRARDAVDRAGQRQHRCHRHAGHRRPALQLSRRCRGRVSGNVNPGRG